MLQALWKWRWLLLWLSWVPLASGQMVVATTNPARLGSGSLSVSFQSYYNRRNDDTVSNLHGSAVSLKHFFPRWG